MSVPHSFHMRASRLVSSFLFFFLCLVFWLFRFFLVASPFVLAWSDGFLIALLLHLMAAILPFWHFAGVVSFLIGHFVINFNGSSLLSCILHCPSPPELLFFLLLSSTHFSHFLLWTFIVAFGCSVAFAIVIYVQLVSFSFLISFFGGILFIVVVAVAVRI